jgi:hypothetical protein
MNRLTLTSSALVSETQQGQPAQAPRSNQEEIRQTIQDAVQAAREAAQEARTEADMARLEALQDIPAPPVPPNPPGGGEFNVRMGPNGLEFVQTASDGTTTVVPYDAANVIPPQVPEILFISVMGLIGIILAFPIGRALARMIDRRGTTAKAPEDLVRRLDAIEQSIDTVAIEMEKMSEANRFTTRLLSERVSAPDFAARHDSNGREHAAPSNVQRSDAIRG